MENNPGDSRVVIYFKDNNNGTYSLVYPNSPTEIGVVPGGENYVLKFNIAQTPGGFIIGTDEFDKIFDGEAFINTPTLQGYNPEDKIGRAHV